MSREAGAGENTIPGQRWNHPFLMKIADRYYRILWARNATIFTFKILLFPILLRNMTLYAVSMFPTGYQAVWWAPGLTALHVLMAVAFYSAKLGSRKESVRWTKVYSMLSMLALAQHALFAYQYHTYFPPTAKSPHAMAEYLVKTKSWEYNPTLKIMQGIEAGVDGVYFVALVAAVLMSKQFVDERRDERKAREAKETEQLQADEAKRLGTEIQGQADRPQGSKSESRKDKKRK